MALPKDNLFYGLAERMTDEQRHMVNSILDKDVVFCNAKAGTGKTTVTLAALYYLYEQKVIDHVYYVFAPVSEREMGYRPGNQTEKEVDYWQPLKDALKEIGWQIEKATDPKYGWLSVKPHTFMRGTNIQRAGVLVDEAQNYTFPQLRKVITRNHDTNHLAVVGHDEQCDLPDPRMSGFVPYLKWFSRNSKSAVCSLTKDFRGWISQYADSIPQDLIPAMYRNADDQE